MTRQQPVSFIADGLAMSGVLHLPDRAPLAVIVGCHGLMSGKNSPKQLELASCCTAAGMAYFRFDHRGCGQSGGVFDQDTTLENRQSDLVAAVEAASEALGKAIPTALFGSSFGGTVCLTAFSRISPFAIVTLAAPVQSRSIRIPEGSPESLKEEILRNRLNFDITAQMASIHHILIIHGSNDETVAVYNAHRIFRLAQDPKRQLILENGDHRISTRSHQQRYLKKTVQWFSDCYHQHFEG